MVVINKVEKGIGLNTRKKLGRSSEYGQRIYGSHKYAEYDHRYGIYAVWTRKGKQINVKLPFYIPTNPRTEAQQANRAIFTAAVLAWQNLTTDQKNGYNEKAKYKHLSGYNLYIREYLLSN